MYIYKKKKKKVKPNKTQVVVTEKATKTCFRIPERLMMARSSETSLITHNNI